MTVTDRSQTKNLYVLHPLAAHRTVAGEVFVVTADRGFHHLHGETSLHLFDSLHTHSTQGGLTLDALVADLTAHFAVDTITAHRDVAAFLDRLLAAGIAVSRPSAESSTANPPPNEVTV